MIYKLNKKKLLATASAAAMSAFVAQSAGAVDLDATASNYTAGGANNVEAFDVTLGASKTQTAGEGAVLSSAKDFTTGAFALKGKTDGLTTDAGATSATDVTVSAGGSVTSSDAAQIAMDINNSIGTITNSGSIIGVTSGNGIDVAASVNVVIVNSGSAAKIESATSGTGINIGGATTGSITNGASGVSTSIIEATGGKAIDLQGILSAGVTNWGVIQDTAAGVGIDIGDNNAVTNKAGGVIKSTTAGAGIQVTGGTTSTISNSGSINATGGIGIDVNAAMTSITNTSTGVIEDDTGLAIDVGADVATISNAGSIQATTGNAIQLTASMVAGKISNTGLITAGTGTTGYALGTGTDATVGGGITNTGTIQNTSDGTAIDFVTRTTASAITINNSGTISTSASTNTAVALGNAMVLTNSGTITGGIDGVDGSAETINLNGGTVTGTIALGTGDDILNVGSVAGQTFTSGGAITGVDDVNVKFGTFNLGHTLTQAGNNVTLDVDLGATLNVTETITITSDDFSVAGAVHIAAGKTLTNSTTGGASNFDVTAASTSKLTFGVATSSSTGKLVATDGAGDVTLGAGSVINFDFTSATESIAAAGSPVTIQDVIDSDTFTNSTGSATASDNSYIYAVTIASDGGNMDVTITREKTLQSSSTDTRVKNVGTALETIGNTGSVDTVVGALEGLETAALVASALETLTPEVNGATTASAVEAGQAAVSVTGTRLADLRSSEKGIAAGSKAAKNAAWGQIFGTTADQEERKGVAGYESDTVGYAIGADTEISDGTTIGLSVSYATTDAKSSRGSADVKSIQVTGYGSHELSNDIWLDGMVAVAFNDYETKRNISVGSISDQSRGDYNGNQYLAKVTVGRDYKVQGPLEITPIASLEYSHLSQDSYTEVGGSAPLTVDNDDNQKLEFGLGAKAAYPLTTDGISYVPELRATYLYDVIGDEYESTSKFSGASTTFISKGADVAQSTFEIGTGVDVLAQEGVTISFDYDYTVREDFDSHGGSLKARFDF